MREIGGGYRRASSVVVGFFSGLTAALVMILVMALLRWGLGIPTPWELVGDRLAPTFDASEFLGLLERFGGYNQLKQLGVGSVLGAQTVVALIGGLVFAAVERQRLKKDPGARLRIGATRPGLLFVTALVLVFWIASLVTLWPVLSTSFSGLPYTQAAIATATGTLVSYGAYGLALILVHSFLTGAAVPPAADPSGQYVIKRRLFLGAGAMAATAAAAFGALSRLSHLATFDYDGSQYIGEDVQAITPNDRFYTVTKNVIDPAVYAPLWRLEVMGMVESPRVYTFDDVKALSGFKQETTLMCISNWVGGGLMSNAVWKGVPLRSLIEAAGPRQGAIEVFFRAADGYTDSISIEKALEPTTIVAYEMNGEPLPQRHGYPVRIVVPGLFGEKNVKWVTRIEVVDHDAKGFYETQGWGPNFVVPTRSRFDFPYYDQTALFTWPIVLKGVAFGGDRGISQVEVSVDASKTWRDASVEYQGTRLTWALWTYRWEPPGPGEFQLVVRATDGSGATQRSEDRGTVPDGATGYHRVTLRLEA